MVFIVTTNDVPGYRIDAVLGEVMAVSVRSHSWGQSFSSGAPLQSAAHAREGR
ncbi:MAG: heavy metal-binding domain-containing protein [Cellulomonadaceae bacterium]